MKKETDTGILPAILRMVGTSRVPGDWRMVAWPVDNPTPTMSTSVRQTCRIAEPSDNSYLYLCRIVTQSGLGAHPRRAHAALANPQRPRKALAVLDGVHPKTGSSGRVPPPRDGQCTSARHAQNRTTASASAHVPRA